ncbi:mitochondrial carrier domain-containing protein [Cladochytrium replicatum]|nr:mitochondrial carrier domain-containing protein [Cladochytrium replicatum]
MSPPVSSRGGRDVPYIPQMIGSSISGFLELVIFHPIDTIGKRLINHRGNIFESSKPFSQGMDRLLGVMFRDAYTKRSDSKAWTLRAYASLFPGFPWAVVYKVSQRTYQFGGHPLITAHLKKQYGGWFVDVFGERHYKTVLHAASGAIIGAGEVMFLPLDALKVKRQLGVKSPSPTSSAPPSITTAPLPHLSPSPLANHAVSSPPSSTAPHTRFSTISSSQLTIVSSPPRTSAWSSRVFSTSTEPPSRSSNLFALYRGASWTAIRNTTGCVALFGAAAATKDLVFHLEDPSHANTFQIFVSAVVGAIASIIVGGPFDVIKVRVQAAPVEHPVKGMQVLRTLIRNEGYRALYKGMGPKLLVAAPKVTFSMFMSAKLGPLVAQYMDGRA